MKNRESKSIEEYFSKAKNLPLAMSFADVQSLVSAKGVTSPPKKSWWNLKNIIIMTISTLFTTAILVYSISFNNTENGKYTPENNSFENISKINAKEERKQFINYQSIENQKSNLVLDEITSTSPGQHSTEKSQEIDFSMIKNSENQSFGSVGFSKYYGSYESKNLVPIHNKRVYEPITNSTVENNEINGETKSITKSVDAANLKTFTLDNKFGNIKIESWDKPTIEVTAHFTLETKDYEDTEKGLDNFKMDLITEGSDVSVTNNWSDYKNCSDNANISFGNKGLFNFSSHNSFTTDQGEKIKYKKFKIEYKVKIPKYFNVNLSNSYSDIELQTIEGVGNIDIFQGKLHANDMKELNLKVKYGTAELNNITNGKVESFQSTFRLGDAEKLTLNAKYSEVKIGGVEDLNLEGFQSNLVANGEIKNLKGNWKYGKIELQKDASNVKIATFQSPFTTQNIDHLTIEMKYGKLNAKSINHLKLNESFQSKIRIINVGKIEGTLKYSPIEIDLLKTEMNLNIYNGNLKVENIGANFTAIDLQSKYADIRLRFESNAKYKLQAETKYSNLIVPDGFRNVRELSNTKTSVQNFSGTFNEAGAGEVSRVNLECYNGKVVVE
ncbi:hypothetical protein [Brumimicrobium mesophilum]|uniref:hypothetical protein n=1 Tax=Brumimicrobium mesophilum TaxID=392717 RepID=UPI000D143B8B|nr:hypothetical protein [Brumimicrobium mesophilum]